LTRSTGLRANDGLNAFQVKALHTLEPELSERAKFEDSPAFDAWFGPALR
jgi:hypothetical protein